MQKHVENYLQAFGYSGFEFIACEVCGGKSVEIHHVEFRSHFGSTRKHEQDAFENLVALCRECHDKAHGVDSRDMKDMLKQITKSR